MGKSYYNYADVEIYCADLGYSDTFTVDSRFTSIAHFIPAASHHVPTPRLHLSWNIFHHGTTSDQPSRRQRS